MVPGPDGLERNVKKKTTLIVTKRLLTRTVYSS